MNNFYYANLLLLKVHHDFSVNENQYRMPIPYPICDQSSKVVSLKALLERSTIKPILLGIIDGYKDLDESVIIDTAQELIEIYFPNSQLCFDRRKTEKYCYYTPRHFVCSGLLTKECKKPSCLLENCCNEWAYIWDAQNHDYVKKVQLLRDILSLPCTSQKQEDN